MLNIETLKMVCMLNEIAELAKNGIEEFSKALKNSVGTKILYDENSTNSHGYYRVVCSALVDGVAHRDIISYYDSIFDECDVGVIFLDDCDENDCIYKKASVIVNVGDEEIFIENGKWYFIWKTIPI